jgi:hypothetical protein
LALGGGFFAVSDDGRFLRRSNGGNKGGTIQLFAFRDQMHAVREIIFALRKKSDGLTECGLVWDFESGNAPLFLIDRPDEQQDHLCKFWRLFM